MHKKSKQNAIKKGEQNRNTGIKKGNGVIKKYRDDGSENPHYVDVLVEDKPITGQKFGCFSFISPEKILQDKTMFYISSFLKKWNYSKSVKVFDDFLHYISEAYKIDYGGLASNFEEFIKDEKDKLSYESLYDDYKTYLDFNELNLENEFNKRNEFQTSIRAFKCRGVYSSEEEANYHAKLIRESDPSFDVLVGPVGVWLPWDPDAYKTGHVEYMEDELNQLMHEKIKNEELAKAAFDERIKDVKKKAMEENKAKAEKYGNRLSQELDEVSNNLVGIKNTQEKELIAKANAGEIKIDDIRNTLFEGENIVMRKK
jgi:hypothetical protein